MSDSQIVHNSFNARPAGFYPFLFGPKHGWKNLAVDSQEFIASASDVFYSEGGNSLIVCVFVLLLIFSVSKGID